MATDFSVQENRQAFVDALLVRRLEDKKAQQRAASKRWAANNKDTVKAMWARYSSENRDRLRAAAKMRYDSNGGREKSREQARSRRLKNPELVISKSREWRYGVTQEAFNEMLSEQNFKCATCPDTPETSNDWHVDHCHTTNVVRGLLCRRCNLMLGYARDNIETLKAAISYLEKHSGGKRREERPLESQDAEPNSENGSDV